MPFSPDESRVVTASHGGLALVWRASEGTTDRVLRGHSGEILSCAFSPDGRRLVTASADHTFKLWDTNNWKQLRTFHGHRGPVEYCAFSPDNQLIASVSRDGTTRIWSAERDEEIRVLGEDASWVRFVLWSGRNLISGGIGIRIWNSDDARLVSNFDTGKEVVRCLAVSADGRHLLYGTATGNVHLCNIVDGTQIFSTNGHEAPVRCCGFSHDGRFVWSGSMDQMVRIWRMDPPGHFHQVGEHDGWVLAGAALPSHLLLSGSQDQFLRLWNFETGALQSEFWVGAPVLSIASHRGGRIAVGDSNGQVHILQLMVGIAARERKMQP